MTLNHDVKGPMAWSDLKKRMMLLVFLNVRKISLAPISSDMQVSKICQIMLMGLNAINDLLVPRKKDDPFLSIWSNKDSLATEYNTVSPD